jgi:hypothetical protein
LPPIVNFVALHDRVHVLAQHYCTAFVNDVQAACRIPVQQRIISTWNLVEARCIDVLYLPIRSPMMIDEHPSSPFECMSLEEMAKAQNDAFAVIFNALLEQLHYSTPSSPDGSAPFKPLPSHKLLPSWCTLDAKLGCLQMHFERKNLFQTDLTRSLLLPARAQHPLSPHTWLTALFSNSSFPSSARLNIGEALLYTLLTEWISLEHLAAEHTRKLSGQQGAVSLAPLQLRPLAPSSKLIADILFPDSVQNTLTAHLGLVEGLGRSMERLGAAGASGAPSEIQPCQTTITFITTPVKTSGLLPIVSSLPLVHAVAWNSGLSLSSAVHAPSISFSSSRSPLADSMLSVLHTCRRRYQELIPDWISGIVFAPCVVPDSANTINPAIGAKTDRARKTPIVLETPQERMQIEREWTEILKHKTQLQLQQQLVMRNKQQQPPLVQVPERRLTSSPDSVLSTLDAALGLSTSSATASIERGISTAAAASSGDATVTSHAPPSPSPHASAVPVFSPSDSVPVISRSTSDRKAMSPGAATGAIATDAHATSEEHGTGATHMGASAGSPVSADKIQFHLLPFPSGSAGAIVPSSASTASSNRRATATRSRSILSVLLILLLFLLELLHLFSPPLFFELGLSLLVSEGFEVCMQRPRQQGWVRFPEALANVSGQPAHGQG